MTISRRPAKSLAAIALLAACFQSAHSGERPAPDALSYLYAAAAEHAASTAPRPEARSGAPARDQGIVTAVAPVVSVMRVRTLADGTRVLVCDTERRIEPPRMLDRPIRARAGR